mmetsp:Transcript_16083/g.53929  ORF Transcript_16083/g.53929 Transcript_16083/m.53929 type:complete len:113 (+) Transcript_16083:635-973(+)
MRLPHASFVSLASSPDKGDLGLPPPICSATLRSTSGRASMSCLYASSHSLAIVLIDTTACLSETREEVGRQVETQAELAHSPVTCRHVRVLGATEVQDLERVAHVRRKRPPT